MSGRSEYDEYVRLEWSTFNEASVRATLRAAVGGADRVSRVLDVGCGAGQMMRPLVSDHGVFGVGVDFNSEVGHAGRELFREYHPAARVAFVRSRAEALPWPSETFDLVICRLALPYTENTKALAEMARVLRPRGTLLLTIHHWYFYLHEMAAAARSMKLKMVVHDARVIAAGTVYTLTGRQPRNRILGFESFQSHWLLRKELRKYGLVMRGDAPDTNRDTPSFVIEKGPAPVQT